jgi:hypothetical protein
MYIFNTLIKNVGGWTYIVPPDDTMYWRMCLDMALKVHIIPLLQVPAMTILFILEHITCQIQK